MIKQRQSNFEALKILGMLMILAHHFVAKNGFVVDSEIIGITFNKVFFAIYWQSCVCWQRFVFSGVCVVFI